MRSSMRPILSRIDPRASYCVVKWLRISWEIGYRQGIDWVLNCLFWPVWPNFEKFVGFLVTGYRHGLS